MIGEKKPAFAPLELRRGKEKRMKKQIACLALIAAMSFMVKSATSWGQFSTKEISTRPTLSPGTATLLLSQQGNIYFKAKKETYLCPSDIRTNPEAAFLPCLGGGSVPSVTPAPACVYGDITIEPAINVVVASSSDALRTLSIAFGQSGPFTVDLRNATAQDDIRDYASAEVLRVTICMKK